jgi:hypothetical protein
MKVKSENIAVSVGLCSSVLVAICAISPGSLWIDEFGTWFLTRADSLPDWWNRFESWPDSDSLIPLYHFFTYIWIGLFGTDTVAMRASNAGMFAVATLSLLWPFRLRLDIAFPIILTSCLSATIWYYLNEVRPYIMLYMGTCLMVGAAIEMLKTRQCSQSFTIKILCIGAVISSGATVLGIVWAGSLILFVLIYWLLICRESLQALVKHNYFALAFAVLCITGLIVHDIRMFVLGKLPALLESNILTLAFSVYANVGLLGIGPGMLDIRENGAIALLTFAPIIGCSTILFGLVLLAGLLTIRILLGVRTVAILIGCALLPVLFCFALGLILHWRVLPRHLIPLVSLFSILYAFGLTWWWRRGLAGKGVALMSVIMMAYSSFSTRMAPRHAKDDYKHAADLARIELAHNGRVWWVADFRGALYYSVQYVSSELDGPQARYDRGVNFFVGEKTFSYLSAEKSPTLVLLSKPETYDKHNVVRDYLSANGYRQVELFTAFTAWRR